MTELYRLVVEANGGKTRGAQTRLADLLSVEQASVSRWCSGKSRPDPDILPSLAKELGITRERLEEVLGAGTMVAEAAVPYGAPRSLLERISALERRLTELEKVQRAMNANLGDIREGQEGDVIRGARRRREGRAGPAPKG